MSRNIVSRPGEYTGDLITDTGAATGAWDKIQILEETAFATLTGDYAIQGALADAIFPKGALIGGHFTAITLSYGSVWAYRGQP